MRSRTFFNICATLLGLTVGNVATRPGVSEVIAATPSHTADLCAQAPIDDIDPVTSAPGPRPGASCIRRLRNHFFVATTTHTEAMTSDAIRSATPRDEAVVADVLTLAFSTDPAARWSWPDPRTYLAHFPRFVRAFGGQAFLRGTAHFIEGYKGAALWLPPGAEPDEAALGALMQDSVDQHALQDASELIERMAGYHPTEPHWYLPLIGIDPAHQGKGLGSALMRHALAECDREGSLAYLESSSPANVPLYQRHGFELLGTIQVGGSPEIFPMLRRPHQ